MVAAEQDDGETPVRLPGTKPAMRFGIPISTWSVIICAPTEFLIFQAWELAIYVTAFLMMASWLLYRYDHNVMRIVRAWWKNRARDQRRFRRRGMSCVPALPVRPFRAYRGVPYSGMGADHAGV